PGAAEEVLAALQRLVHDLGMTVVMAEHRLERVVQYADRIIVVPGDAQALLIGTPQEVMREAPIAPPVVELGRIAGWTPLPLSVRDARRAAGPLRALLVGQVPPLRAVFNHSGEDVLVEAEELTVRYGTHSALRNVSLRVHRGEIVALMGRNGAGKSTLLNAMVGLRTGTSGSIMTHGRDASTLKGSDLLKSVGLVPQVPGDLLEATTVAAECKAADRDAQADAGTARALLALLAPEILDTTHPRDLSEGQRLLLALAVVLAARPPLLLLDEPTRGLDYPTKIRLANVLRDLASAGHGIMLATHDVELAAEVATRVMVIAEGEIVADGSTADVVVSSPMFAPQVAKVLAPHAWLTVSDVVATMGPLILRTHAPISGGAVG
ncbi:MAG: ATP-binding cassette domain-containing protein, partial [Actinomycetota bacterium]|nr:ATP-binding cassette domain-containing protein [Actinomycetota bacterium]